MDNLERFQDMERQAREMRYPCRGGVECDVPFGQGMSYRDCAPQRGACGRYVLQERLVRALEKIVLATEREMAEVA